MILATEEVMTDTLNVISAIAKVLLATKKLVSANLKVI